MAAVDVNAIQFTHTAHYNNRSTKCITETLQNERYGEKSVVGGTEEISFIIKLA